MQDDQNFAAGRSLGVQACWCSEDGSQDKEWTLANDLTHVVGTPGLSGRSKCPAAGEELQGGEGVRLSEVGRIMTASTGSGICSRVRHARK